MSSKPRRSIAVVGGGIGGLAAAAFLRRAGLAATVYEQASQLEEVGAGLVVAPNAARLLQRLPAALQVADVGVALETGWEFRRWADGTVLFAQELGDTCVRRYGEHTWTMHRADLLAVLASALPEDAVELGRRCTGVAQDDDGVTLTFAAGEPVRAEAVIAADGIHSVLREHVTEASVPRPSGLCAWRSLVPADAVPGFARRPVQTLWLGHRHHLVHYPVRSGELVNIVAFSPALAGDVESWSAAGRVEDFAAEFGGWDQRVGELIGAATRVGRWSVLDRAPLGRWVNGRIALLGDAAHPMLPFYAQGAGQAIEDAAVLAACLASGSDDVAKALTRYERVRLPRASRVQEASRGRTAHHHLPDGPEQRARDAAFAAEDPLSHNDWIYSYDAEKEAAAVL
ncbi:MAG: FAD-dependent monooxygenase [Actinobacteria bacterium]|nr:FAD-dependent monooxygenase [Actinomycetota bacterium]MBO0834111.1 FAD-dependent monooxygenase [Actinomycetota bacterium]